MNTSTAILIGVVMLGGVLYWREREARLHKSLGQMQQVPPQVVAGVSYSGGTATLTPEAQRVVAGGAQAVAGIGQLIKAAPHAINWAKGALSSIFG